MPRTRPTSSDDHSVAVDEATQASYLSLPCEVDVPEPLAQVRVHTWRGATVRRS